MPDNLPRDLEDKIKDIPAVYHCNFSIAHYNVFIRELVAKLKSKPKHLPNNIVVDHRFDRSIEGVRTISRELLIHKI
jgi:capsule polysaccharide modification protein KpsS